MLSVTEITAIKQGGSLPYAMSSNRDDLSLQRKISTIETERLQRLREIDAKRRQFIHDHHRTVPKNAEPRALSAQRQKELLDAGKLDQESIRCSLDKKTAEFIGDLKERPLTAGITRTSLLDKLRHDEEKRENIHKEGMSAVGPSDEKGGDGKTSENCLSSDRGQSKALDMYQKSFAMIRQKRDQRKNPFLLSVNSIIEKLNTADDKNSTNEMQSSFTKLTEHVLSSCIEQKETPQGGEVSPDEEQTNSQPQSEVHIVQSKQNASHIKRSPRHSVSPRNQVDHNQRKSFRNGLALSTDIQSKDGNNNSPKHQDKSEHSPRPIYIRNASPEQRGKSNYSPREKDIGKTESLTQTDERTNKSSESEDTMADSDSSEFSVGIRGMSNATRNTLNFWGSVRREQKKAMAQFQKSEALSRKPAKEEATDAKYISINIIPPSSRGTVSIDNDRLQRRSSNPKEMMHNNSMRQRKASSPGEYVSALQQTWPTRKESLTKTTLTTSHTHLSVDALKAHDANFSTHRRLSDSVSVADSSPKIEIRRSNSVGNKSQATTSSINIKPTKLLDKRNEEITSNTLPRLPVVENHNTTIIVIHDDGKDQKNKPTERRSIFEDPLSQTKLSCKNFSNQESRETVGEGHKTFHKDSEVGCSDTEDGTESKETTSSVPLSNPAPLSRTDSKISNRSDSTGTWRRRMSMGTSGSLRLWAAVQREETLLQEKHAEAELTTGCPLYQEMLAALSDAVVEVEEQEQRLAMVKRYRPSLVGIPQDLMYASTTPKEPGGRRGSISGRKNAPLSQNQNTVDPTDAVYQFLQRRMTSSNVRRASSAVTDLSTLSGTPETSLTERLSFRSGSGQTSVSTSPLGDSKAGSSTAKLIRTGSLNFDNRRRSSIGREILSNAFSSISPRPRRNSICIGTEYQGTNRLLGLNSQLDDISETGTSTKRSKLVRKDSRSFSWAPDVVSAKQWHILALELLSKNKTGMAKFRTVSHLLQSIGEEYRNYQNALLFDELRYCTYLRIPNHYLPDELKDDDVRNVFKDD